MPNKPSPSKVRVASEYQPLFRHIGFTPEMVFDDPAIRIWRILPDRENGVWDVTDDEGEIVRMHVKRYPRSNNTTSHADDEAAAFRELEYAQIPTAKLIAWGTIPDDRSFVLIQDLTGYEAADKLIQSGTPFEKILKPTADLAADLHNAGFHHRDLYLCHFFVDDEAKPIDVRLIDVARVARLSGWFRQRWIIKDLAQFWYSTFALLITNPQRDEWLKHYADARKITNVDTLRRSIAQKATSIAAHDANLKFKQPGRNISIPRNQMPKR